MTDLVGYTALGLNLLSMAMKNVLHLRLCSLVANMLYIIYGIALDAMPVIIGCSAAVLLHAFRIVQLIRQKRAAGSGG